MFGSHLSIAGGMHNAVVEGAAPRVRHGSGLHEKPATVEGEAAGRVGDLGVEENTRATRNTNRPSATTAYLINLASPDEDALAEEHRPIRRRIEEVRGARHPVPRHPSRRRHVGTGEEAGLARVAKALDELFATVDDAPHVTTCLEITCRSRLMSWLQARTPRRHHRQGEATEKTRRLPRQKKTAHLFAAGYDFRRGKKYDAFRKDVEKTIGIKRVKVLHLNDSKKELGSPGRPPRAHRPRHDRARRISAVRARDEAFEKVPKILETGQGEAPRRRDWDAVNVESSWVM
jgi:deoxyribonuclease-4